MISAIVCERRILYVKAEERVRERRTEGRERRILDVKPESGCVSAESVNVSADSVDVRAELPKACMFLV